jgi:membrane protease YdiL (CAAX protease family)
MRISTIDCFGSGENQPKLANLAEIGKLRPAINHARTSAIPPRNPYLTILRRDYPEPFIALLAFVLGIWLWDHYFGKPGGYPPGTEEVALVKIDRDLRLADAMAEDPPWLRSLAGADDPQTARENTLLVFKNLLNEDALSLAGVEAFAIVKAVQDKLPPREVLAEVLKGQMLSDFTETSDRLANHQGTWWHAKLIEDWEKNMRPAYHWRQSYGDDGHQLRARAIIVRSSVWLIGLAGLAFIPATLATLKRGLTAKPRGYGGAWSLPLGLVVFLVATLAWIGFTMTLELGIATLPGLHPAVGIFLDSAARLLPSLIALGLLFRRPSHAIRVMGLNKPFATKTILGLFSLLMIIDQILRRTLGSDTAGEPGGGLSIGEAGLWGLAFAVTSACLLAPLAEELLYRGVLFRSFWNRLGVIPAAILSSAIFAILHFYDGYGLASVGVFGLSCALLYAATGSLAASIVLHMLYNSAIKIPEWLIYHGPLG